MTASISETDEEIARRAQKGDREAFGELVKRYEDKMLRYARRFLFGYEDAEDHVQDVFIKAYTKIQSFDVKRRFSPWLYRVAHNTFVNAIKKRGREPISFVDFDVFFPHPRAKEATDGEVLKNEMRDMLDKCLGELDVKYREPLILYYFEDLSYKQIADILRIPTSTVGVRMKRGRAALKKVCDATPFI
jgi:RNA polymerase sigma-70 factor, ECF subfamily